MKWAHIINISFLFDCPPNKSHCSNKQRALLHCLPLSGFELLTLQLAIYYRHLSQVTDKHCDGCMIWLCQNGFISPLQATIASQLMSCAQSLSSDFLSLPPPLFFFFLLIPQMATTVSLILQRTHFTRNKRILLFTDLVIYALCGFSHSFQFICSCLCVFVSASTHMWMTLQAYACACAAFTASEQGRNQIAFWGFFFCLMLFHIVILHSRCNILLFRNPTINHLNCCWQTSKSFRLAAHFLSISNTQVDSSTKEQKLQNAVCV